MKMKKKTIRKFETGATRDTDEDKFDYEGFISPIVLQKFAEYMNKHRIQADGGLRNSDNWQEGFGDEHLSVCFKSAHRHFMDLWLHHRGFKNEARESIDDAINGVLFNIMAYQHWLLKHGKKKMSKM